MQPVKCVICPVAIRIMTKAEIRFLLEIYLKQMFIVGEISDSAMARYGRDYWAIAGARLISPYIIKLYKNHV